MSAPDLRHPVIRTIEVVRAPGLPDRFRLDGLGPGVTIVTGPNGSGKSTTARLIQRLFWPKPEDDGADVRFAVGYDGGDWHVERQGTRVSASRDGAIRDFPIADMQSREMGQRYLLALHDLLVGSDDRVFAQEVARAMRGGFDLDAAVRSLAFTNQKAKPKPEAERFNAARKEMRDRTAAQDALAAQEADIARLDAVIADADAASAEVHRLDAIATALEASDRLAQAGTRLAALPPTLERVAGDEPARLDTLARERRTLETQRTDLEAQRLRAGEELARTALEPGPSLDLALDSATRRRDGLKELDHQRQQTTRDLEAARARRAAAAANVGDRLPQPLASRDGVAALEEIAAALATSEAAANHAAVLGELQGLVAGRAARQEVKPLTDGIGALVRWLQAPPPPDPSAHAATRRLALVAYVAAGLLVALALVLLVTVHPVFALVILLAAGVAGAGWHGARPIPYQDLRPERQADYERTGQPAPAAWTDVAVREQLERQVEAFRLAEVGNVFADRLDHLGRQIVDARRAAEQRAQDAAAVAARSGMPLDDVSSSKDVTILVDRLKALLDADDQIVGLDARLAQITLERSALLATVGADLAPFHVAPADDLATLEAVLDALRKRAEQASRAQATLDAVRRDLVGNIEPNLARIDRERATILARLEVADEAAALALVAQLPEWRAARTEWQSASATADDRRQRAGVDLAEWTPVCVANERTAAFEREGRRSAAFAARSEIVVKIAEAKEASRLGDAIATVATASADLADKYDRELGRLIGWEIAEQVRDQTRHANLPQVMRNARDIFARITRDRYELQIDPATQEFRARDVVHGGALSLEQLSSATRVQLLLAVRAAFVEANEQGVRLPLLLDETLANADEERAEAIIHAVFDLAREGRQIFYFTAQEDEVGKWRQLAAGEQGGPLQVIDLRDARALGESRDALEAMPPPARRLPPDPAGHDWASYGALLGVPAVDPWAGAATWHLWRLVDDVADLHTLLARSIDTVGRAAFALERLGDVGLGLPADRGAALRARIALVEALVALWRQGRGRPTTWADIMATGDMRQSFAESGPALFEACGRDAKVFVERIRNGELKGFRGHILQNLEEKLRAQGFIVDEEPFGPEDLRLQAVVAAGPALDAGQVDMAHVDRWLAALDPTATAGAGA
jgi:uncharacterized protein YhaN